MYFLGGERIYIKPENGCAPLDLQLHNCLNQLRLINGDRRVFKLNFFVDAVSDEDYIKLQDKIHDLTTDIFPYPIVTGIIAQPPLTCRIILEAFFYSSTQWKATSFRKGICSASFFKKENTEVLIGNVESNLGGDCRQDAEFAFSMMGTVLREMDFPVESIIRQWNYIRDILGFDDGMQRYQEFNNVRSLFYGDNFDENGFPAATGIGMNRGGVMIEFVAIKSAEMRSLALDNPDQIAAHRYSEEVLVGQKCVLKTTPKFERARYLDLYGRKMIFISGTASITGEETVGIQDPVTQTKVTIANIRKLYADEVLAKISGEKLTPRYGHARVYIKNRHDFRAIRRTFSALYGNLPVVYIIADICRDNLLVEIEGKVVLD